MAARTAMLDVAGFVATAANIIARRILTQNDTTTPAPQTVQNSTATDDSSSEDPFADILKQAQQRETTIETVQNDISIQQKIFKKRYSNNLIQAISVGLAP